MEMYSINIEETLSDAINAIRQQINSVGAIIEIKSTTGIHRNMSVSIPDLRTVLRAMCALALPYFPYDIFTLNLEEETWFDGKKTLTVEVIRSGSFVSDETLKSLPAELKEFGITTYDYEYIEGLGAKGSITIEIFYSDDELITNFDFLTISKDPNMDIGSLADFSSDTTFNTNSVDIASTEVSSVTSSSTPSFSSSFVEDSDVELPLIPDISWDYATMLSGSNSIALATAQGFYKNIEASRSSIDSLHNDLISGEAITTEKVDNYRIAVHGMKGSAAAFGAMQLSGLCRLLEFAARNHDYNRIEVLHPILMSELKRIMLDWAELKPQEAEKPYTDDNTSLIANLNVLQTALEDFDIDGADAAAAAINEYQYSDFIQYRIDALLTAVENIDNDTALKECNELIKLLG